MDLLPRSDYLADFLYQNTGYFNKYHQKSDSVESRKRLDKTLRRFRYQTFRVEILKFSDKWCYHNDIWKVLLWSKTVKIVNRVI